MHNQRLYWTAMPVRRPANRSSHPVPKKRKAVAPAKNPRTTNMWEELAEIGRRVPDEVWAQFPTDLAKNFDHYAHGSPREED